VVRSLRIALVALITTVLAVATQPAMPANAWDSMATYNNGSFIRSPDNQPIMTYQEKCVYCVASGTQAWIDYTWLVQGNGNLRPTQDGLWGYFNSVHGCCGNYNIDPITRCSPAFPYTRRGVNWSQDDGVDPHGAAWAMWNYTNTGYYYHVNVYSTGPSVNGFDYGAHGAAWTLANYSEPVGVVIDNGGHFVLITYVQSAASPLADFWTTISLVRYRDPFILPGAYPYTGNRVERTYAQWRDTFNEYGYNGHDWAPTPNCGQFGTNCRDEVHVGPYAHDLWWARWVTVERDGYNGQDPDFVYRISQ
jgi:hypothetical protein